jgi:cell division protein FtsL
MTRYKRTRNLILFLLVCVLIAGVAYLMIQYQNDYNSMNQLLEAQR